MLFKYGELIDIFYEAIKICWIFIADPSNPALLSINLLSLINKLKLISEISNYPP